MAARGGIRESGAVTPLPENERDFLGVLRDRALSTVELPTGHVAAGLTQLELEQSTGMSRPSVVNLVKHLRPVLRDEPGEGARGGRIGLDPAVGVAIGVEIGHACVSVAVSDLFGRILEPESPEEFQRDGDDLVRNADATLDWIVDAIERRLAELGLEPDDVAGVGIGIAGPVDREKGVIREAVPLSLSDGDESDWQLLSARDHLRWRLGWDHVPFILDNDANLGALAEHMWGAARPRPDGGHPYRNVLYVEWSRGVGAGLILQGRQYRGAGVAGELGHTIVKDDGPRCPRCGNLGCLDSLAGWDAIGRDLEGFETLDDALRAARDEDGPARRAFQAAAVCVARALGPAITVLNPELVVIGGSVGQGGYDVIKSPLLRTLKRYTMRPALRDVEIVGAVLQGGRTALHGALGLVLRSSGDDRDALLSFVQRKAGSARGTAARA